MIKNKEKKKNQLSDKKDYTIDDLDQDAEKYIDIINEYHRNNPFWQRYDKFLISQKIGEFDKFISIKPKSRLG